MEIRLHLWLRRYPRSPLALTLSRTRRSRLSSALHVMRAHPRSRPDGHRADQRCAHATLRGRLRAARSVHAEQSLLPLLAISAPSHMLLSVLLPGRPCATVCHATQGLPVLDERVLERDHQLSIPRRTARARVVHQRERAASRAGCVELCIGVPYVVPSHTAVAVQLSAAGLRPRAGRDAEQ